ncbi:MAG: FAD-dependent oxidoreductase [Gammaproteobacteria bacterium]|nr:FAD-dependent oxidoreductase [Gammaproteobacteria bacterium]
MSQTVPDVLILGGGVIGLACAYELLKAGRSVHLLERQTVGSGTSHGNCGTITPSHALPLAAPGAIAKALKSMLRPDAPFYIKPRADLALASWLVRFASRCNGRDWRRTAEAKGELLQLSRRLTGDLVREQSLDCEFQARGLRYVYATQQALDADCANLPLLASLGIESQLLDGGALASAEPALLPGLAGGVHFPGDAQLRPERFTSELARLVRSLGGVIEEGIEVRGFRSEAGRIAGVDTDKGQRRGREVLAALGPWSAPLLGSVGLTLPIQPGKGYSMTYSPPSVAPCVPLVLREHSVCVTAWQSGFRLGSTMEFSGYDSALNPVRLDALERGAARYLREPVGPERREQWFGWRPMTYDDLPLIGRAPKLEGLWLATGHGMMGMGMSAATGLLVADLMTGREACIDPSPYRATRFA